MKKTLQKKQDSLKMDFYTPLLLLVTASIALACTCPERNLPDLFDKAEFVIKGKPVRAFGSPNPYDYDFEAQNNFNHIPKVHYTVKILKVYKGHHLEGFKRGNNINVGTYQGIGMCGELLMGNKNDKKPWLLMGSSKWLSSCDLNKKWEILGESERKFLKKQLRVYNRPTKF